MRNAEIAEAFEELASLYELDGAVAILANNAASKDYGPLVVLEHAAGDLVKVQALIAHGHFHLPSERAPI